MRFKTFVISGVQRISEINGLMSRAIRSQNQLKKIRYLIKIWWWLCRVGRARAKPTIFSKPKEILFPAKGGCSLIVILDHPVSRLTFRVPNEDVGNEKIMRNESPKCQQHL